MDKHPSLFCISVGKREKKALCERLQARRAAEFSSQGQTQTQSSGTTTRFIPGTKQAILKHRDFWRQLLSCSY
jgi:hypothetical protein